MTGVFGWPEHTTRFPSEMASGGLGNFVTQLGLVCVPGGTAPIQTLVNGVTPIEFGLRSNSRRRLANSGHYCHLAGARTRWPLSVAAAYAGRLPRTESFLLGDRKNPGTTKISDGLP